MRRTGFALAAVLLAGPVAPPAGPAAAAPGGRPLVVATLQEPDSLNPFVGTSVTSAQLFRLTYRFLTSYRPADNQPVGDLAESWTVSPDGRTWTFRLRTGTRWSDGTPVTAADVAFTYTTVMRHPETANAALAAPLREVTAPDPATLVIRTKAPTPTMLDLDIPIVPAHVWAGRDPDTAVDRPGPLTVGSGPYRLDAASPGQFYRLVADPGYAPAPARVDTLVFQHFADSDAAAQALRKGDVDVVANLTPAQYGALGNDAAVHRVTAGGTRFTELAMNPGAGRSDGTPIGDGAAALRDPRLRAAIEYALDRPTLVAKVLAGDGVPGAGYLPPTDVPWSWQPGPAQLRGYDPGRADRDLDAAGYRRGPGGIRTGPDGAPLVFRLYVPSSRALYQQSATYLTRWLAAVGIKVTPRLMSDTQLGQLVAAGRFDLYLTGWVLDPDPDFLLSVQTCGARPDAAGNGTTDAFVCDPRYDDLYARQARTMDPGARAALVRAAQAQLYAGTDQVVLFYPAVLEAYRADRFGGFVQRPAGGSVAGPWSYVRAVPAAGAVAAAPRSGPPGGTGLVVAVVGLVVAGLFAAGFALARRRGRDQRE